MQTSKAKQSKAKQSKANIKQSKIQQSKSKKSKALVRLNVKEHQIGFAPGSCSFLCFWFQTKARRASTRQDGRTPKCRQCQPCDKGRTRHAVHPATATPRRERLQGARIGGALFHPFCLITVKKVFLLHFPKERLWLFHKNLKRMPFLFPYKLKKAFTFFS